MSRGCVLRIAVVLTLLVTAAGADDSLSPETMGRVKQATVYIKVVIGPLELFGSGFVVQSSGDSALVVTNDHVVTKPAVLAPGGYIPGLRGRDRMALRRLQSAVATSEPVVTVVFNSGEPNEQSIKADVLCKLAAADLAVLKVSSVKNSVTPIDFRNSPQPTETMPVFMLGFPFGESLSTNKGNPNITVGKGSVSSIRKDAAGKVVKIQIDGALNPGNSGGPVIDRQGNLVGIAVQTVQGSNIGLAIPAGELVSVFQGTFGAPTVAIKPGTSGPAAKFDLVVPKIDPTNQLRSATVHLVSKALTPDPSKAGQPQLVADASARKIDLTLNGNDARAELPPGTTGGQQITVQVSYVNGQGASVYLEPQVITVPAPVEPGKNPGGVTAVVVIGPDGTTTTTTTTTTQNGKGGTSSRVTTTRRSSSSSGNRPAGPGGGKKSAFKTGDQVRVSWGGKVQDAEVINVDGNSGWVMVKFSSNGLEMTPTLPPDQVELAGDDAPKRAPASSEEGTAAFQAGDKVRIAWAGKVENAEVINVNGNNGWVTVKFRRNGLEMTPTLPPDKIELAVKKKKAPSPAVTSDSKLRTWSNKSGKFKIKAKFVELKNDSVTLEKEDGETVTVALDKLSEADQKAARELAEGVEENPFGE
ncbi:MAG TPA: trypsin-like peptidase domain-containing protein [Pirellulales bacterium]|nr:trypsin-like peptidase domain-containing protein [Pirellulales bacterium]